jgi:hypothetical protein
MSTTHVQAAKPQATPGHVWAVLNTERLDACADLNGGTGPRVERQRRLSQIDRALDLLMDGRYGRCVECGSVIEQNRLSADPALTVCDSCQTGIEIEHTL